MNTTTDSNSNRPTSRAKSTRDFANEWKALRAEHEEGVLHVEDKNAAETLYEVAFRDIAFKD